MKITQKQSSSSSQPSKYVKNMEKLSRLAGFDHQNAIVFSTLIGEINVLEKKLSYYHSRIKKLEKSVDCIENYIEERTGLEPGKELTDSSESSSSESEVAYTIEEGPKESGFMPLNKVIIKSTKLSSDR
jgi:predicted RNase H-like nuclease (RuvC/YqgF family)